MTESNVAHSYEHSHAPPALPARCGIADPDSEFTFLRTSASELPDPEPLLINLTRSVIEVIAGARDLEQLSRWISEDVYRALVKQAVISARARSLKNQNAVRPIVHVGTVHVQMPVDDVCEAVIMVQVGRTRARAVAIRLEGIDHRWRATSIGVL
ncbi:Rv3235 family protein [Microbacterium sp. MPKO10]|uniref:Rv3235 family protein n=1 Tax=Microbacterium sp. MPKO10 TaxID=2989818 RepID=UPI0022360C89|nr:Rv3235 family protein [Microbacterium sp. MPKO10]MCW4458444.1 Rv3235 family protein [Microbacterium sp. MPKO10]